MYVWEFGRFINFFWWELPFINGFADSQGWGICYIFFLFLNFVWESEGEKCLIVESWSRSVKGVGGIESPSLHWLLNERLGMVGPSYRKKSMGVMKTRDWTLKFELLMGCKSIFSSSHHHCFSISCSWYMEKANKKRGESRNEKGIIWLQNSRLLSGMWAQAYESVPHVCMCAFLAGNASSNMASSTLRPKP